MAASLIGGLVPEQFLAQDVCVYDINEDALSHLATEFAVTTTTELEQALNNADIVVLAVKPQVLQKVCEGIQNLQLSTQPLFISIAAGIRSVDIDRWLGTNQAVVRCMPNTPSLLQCGASGLFANQKVTSEQKEQALNIMQAVGLSLWVTEEEQLDIVTALSGSGPAYFFLFIESLQKAAEKLGLDASVASQLAAQTAFGAASMAKLNDDVAQLRKNVTSKGGTTEQALLSFAQNDLSNIVDQAVNAAFNRSKQMADELSGC